MLKVNVGCGEFPAEGWVNVDSYSGEGTKPDIVATADKLPFEDHSVSVLYAGHVLEHIPFEAVPRILDEFKRVLSSDGELCIVGPDIDRALKDFPEEVESIRHGAKRWPGDEHLWESSETTMLKLLQENGWKASPIPIIDAPREWPITSRIGWQFSIHAIL